MIKYLFVVALVACFAAASAQTETESEFPVGLAIMGAKALIGALKKKKKDAVESDKINIKKYLTPENLQKAVEIWKILKNKDEAQSDLFGKLGKKIGGVVSKGVEIYSKAKGLGILADEEVEKKEKKAKKEKSSKKGSLRKALVAMLKKKLAARLQKGDKTEKKEKSNKKPFSFKKFIAKWKQIKAAKKEKKQTTESDAEFLSKLKNWWDSKGKNLYNKGKEIYNIIKAKNEAESDAEFLKKLKNWWDNKGKDLFNKGKELYTKGKQVYEIIKAKDEVEADLQICVDTKFGKICYNKDEVEADSEFKWANVKKYLTPENLQKAVDIWKIIKAKDDVQADAELKINFKKIFTPENIKKAIEIYKMF